MKSINLRTLFEFGPASLRPDGCGGIIEGTIPWHEIDWYAAQLLAEGADVIVESPPELIAAIRHHIQVVAELYQC